MARPFATPEQREDTRRKIRHAAATIYRRDGAAAISARGIAKEAGVSVGAIYAYFGDLKTLMQSFWTGPVDRQNEKFREIAASLPDPIARLRALMSAYLQFGIENADLYRNAFLFVRPASHDKPDTVPLEALDFPRLLIAALREGQAQGRIVAGDPDDLAQILWSGLHGALALPANIDRIAFQAPRDLAVPLVTALLRAIVK